MACLAQFLDDVGGVLVDLIGGDPMFVGFIDLWFHEKRR